MRLDDRIELSDEKLQLIGVGDNEISTMGSFTTYLSADGLQFKTTLHVVAARNLKYDMIIGQSTLKEVDLFVSNGEAKFIDKRLGRGCTVVNKEPVIKQAVKSDETKNYLLNEFKNMCNMAEVAKLDEIDLSYLGNNLKQIVNQIIVQYTPVKNTVAPIKMKLILKDDIPVVQKPRRMSHADKLIVRAQIEKWLSDGIIRPSTSQYAAPIVLVPKKDGTTRICCVYRLLNKKVVKDNFPMALMDDVLERLQRGKIFTTLDLENGFFHVPIEEESIKSTAFVTYNEQYEFMYAPFGLVNSPAVFNRYITVVLRKLIEDNTVVVYMDDIIIPAKDINENIEKINKVLGVAADYGLKIKWRKCQFLRDEVEFLGYIIRDGTIKPSLKKTEAIRNYPVPVNAKALQRFMGLTSYFRRFVYDFATVAKPLSDLLRKNVKYELKDEQLIAFKQLKLALTRSPVLKLFDPDAETEVHADASKFGYGAVLFQKDDEDNQLHPVQYMSRKTSEYEEKYSSYELEVLAVIQALKKWRIYLLGKFFKIITDCNAFSLTVNKADMPVRISRWIMYLQDFNYVVEHRTGTKMKHVDALSRVSCLFLEESMKYKLKQAQMEDNWIKAVVKVLERSDQYEDFYVRQGILYKDPTMELIVVPTKMEDEIIRIAHRNGHFAKKKTQELVEKNFYITDVAKKVESVVKNCVQCIITNTKTGKAEGFISPIDKEDRPFLTYHIDHVGPMEQTQKAYNYIFVVIDAFSKFTWLYPTKSTGVEAVVDKLKQQAAVFGNPRRIISDRGAAFTANAFKQYCEEQKILHLQIATGIPRGNGQVERIHKIVIPMLAKFCHETPSMWYKHVNKVQQIINNTSPRSTKVSPFEIITGVKMRIINYPQLQEILEEELLKEYQEERDAIRVEAKQNIEQIQQENKITANKKRQQASTYNVGDLVAIKRTQYGTAMKLKPKYFGPYKITMCRNHDRYDVEKVGQHEGPKITNTVAENMKEWH